MGAERKVVYLENKIFKPANVLKSTVKSSTNYYSELTDRNG